MENEEKKAEAPKGFEALLKQNEIAEAKEKADKKIEPIEERIRKEAPKPSLSSIKTLRTFKGDVEESISHGGTTIVSMASAKARAQAMRKGVDSIVSSIKSGKTKRLGLYLLCFILIIGSLGVLYYIYSSIQGGSAVVLNIEAPLIFVEKSATIDTTGSSPQKIKLAITDERNNANEKIGTMIEVLLTKTTVTADNKTATAAFSTSDFFQTLDLKAPSSLTRALGPQFLLAVHVFDGNQAFLIFKTTSYENAFAGMLDWESSIETTVGGILRKEGDFKMVGTSTPSLAGRTFQDFVYKNTDTRALRNEAGKILMIYAFPTRDTLIIASNEKTLGAVMDRLTNRQIVQ